MNLEERIENKKLEIAKREKNLVKYVVSDEFTAMCDRYFKTKDFTELRLYQQSKGLWLLPEYYSKRYELEDAKNTLKKYEEQLIKENDKKATLEEMPESLKEFRNELVVRWNKYDEWKKEEIKKIQNSGLPYKDQRLKLREMFGLGWYEFSYLTLEQIHKQNEKDADNLVIDMLNRTVNITGKLTDTQYLYLDRTNEGFAVINGKMIGEKGIAKIESILAGGYNIQRLHVRVLVKEVRA